MTTIENCTNYIPIIGLLIFIILWLWVWGAVMILSEDQDTPKKMTTGERAAMFLVIASWMIAIPAMVLADRLFRK